MIGVIGCGDWGKNIVRTVESLGALSGIVDPKNPSAVSLEALLADNRVQGVMIATPADTHFSIAQQALQHGKHVFIEKPFVKEISQNKELIRLAEDRGLALLSGHLLLYHPAFEKMEVMVHQGALGPLHFLQSRRMNLGKLYPQESVIWDFLPHDLSIMLALMQCLPLRVFATENSYIFPGISDIARVELLFPGGVSGSISLSRLHPLKEQFLTAVGTLGALVFDDTETGDKKLCHKPFSVDREGHITREEGAFVEVTQESPLTREVQHFIDVMAGRGLPRSSGATALEVLKVMEAAHLSIQANAWVDLAF